MDRLFPQEPIQSGGRRYLIFLIIVNKHHIGLALFHGLTLLPHGDPQVLLQTPLQKRPIGVGGDRLE